MALTNYSVLKGRPVDNRFASGANPHYQVLVVDDTDEYRIAVNVQSQDGSDLDYLISSHWQHPLQDNLQELPLGIHPIQNRPNDIALDYIRGNIVDPRLFIPIPMNLPGPDNDLNEKLDHYVQRAMADENSLLYAFGQTWGPENKRDKIFGFKPGAGIHDIHMNQGNDSRHRGDDGVWQDGGLVFQFPGQDQWVGIFLRFQSQAWHTDDTTGHAITIPTSGPPSDAMPAVRLGPDTLPTTDRPDGLIRIVAALVNDIKSPERETITLLNRSNREISLIGWKIAD
ncbi:MAG TPA: YukJ family protein, partial [Nitrososphaeraceae archaeon]|nr:YukJ family protein [Nitrososphaeraceae archaeon]